MRVLIVYATSEGHTRKVASAIESHLADQGHEAAVFDSALGLGNVGLDAFGAIIVAASVHDRVHQETIVDFIIAHRERLQATPSAFLSVSLSAAMEGGSMEARGYIDRIIRETGWHPTETLPVAGALKYSEYDYFRQQIVKDVVFKNDFRIDAERDYEFTDWQALKSFVQNFVEQADIKTTR